MGVLPPSGLFARSGSAKAVSGITHLFSTPSHGFQCRLTAFLTFVVPPSGSIFRSKSKSTSLPLDRSLSAR
ncbi:hypothetical protein BSQ44_24445 [Aquibium oceanicum]|uniref:Uncharacterized protein n=1 Tax=Aquibium oceanicum TaxID=1670800 RepID=A0A1L3SXM2_9HYPH|nr:hypothetical protein BSQ44_24445 [Aquibium oceanicum]